MIVIIKSNWAPYCGTDYCDVLGNYDSLENAEKDASEYAWYWWESDHDDDSGFEDEGPDWTIEEYNPEEHDMLRSGGGSFEDDFAKT